MAGGEADVGLLGWKSHQMSPEEVSRRCSRLLLLAWKPFLKILNFLLPGTVAYCAYPVYTIPISIGKDPRARACLSAESSSLHDTG